MWKHGAIWGPPSEHAPGSLVEVSSAGPQKEHRIPRACPRPSCPVTHTRCPLVIFATECASPLDSPGEQGLKLPLLFTQLPYLCGRVWRWAGNTLELTRTHIRTVSGHVPVHVSVHATFASRGLGDRTACVYLECMRRNLKLEGATNSYNFRSLNVEPDNGHDAIVSS